jgi:hypothetical protein
VNRFCVAFLLGAGCFVPLHLAHASGTDAHSFNRQIVAVLEDPLPAISEILPDYHPTADAGPTLVVADLKNKGDVSRDWGKAVGQILRWDMLFGYRSLVQIVDFSTYYEDATGQNIAYQDIGRELPSVQLVAKRLGINRALGGTIEVNNDTFVLELKLQAMPSGEVLETYHFDGMIAQLPATIHALPKNVFASINARAAPHESHRTEEFGPEKLEKFAGALVGDVTNEKERMRKLWMNGVRIPVVAAHRLQQLRVGADLQSYFDRLEVIGSTLGGDRGIDFSVARFIRFRAAYKTDTRLFETKVQRLKRIVSDNSHDPTPLLELGVALADGGYTLDGLSVCRNALLRFPDNYRTWWCAGYTLLSHAWELRGNSYWRDVSAKGKRQFSALKQLAGHAIDKALSFHDHNPSLWVDKMYAIGTFSEDFMRAFHEAIRLDPTNRRAYEMAVNYTLPQWGGSFDAQDDVLDLATKNVADKDFVQYLRGMYVGDRPYSYKIKRWIKSYLSTPLGAIIGAFLLIAVVFAALRLHAAMREKPRTG